MRAEIEPPSYAECTFLGSPTLTIDIKDTKVYTPCTNHEKSRSIAHYCTTSSLNRDFVKGGFGLFRVSPWKPSEKTELYDVRAVGVARFLLTSLAHSMLTVQRRFGFSGHSWEVKQLPTGSDVRGSGDGGKMVLTAKRTSKDDGTLRWCDDSGRLLATDTKLVRRRGNHENHFQMPVLSILEDVEQELLDILVAAWLARVWCEIVQAKKKTLMDGEYL